MVGAVVVDRVPARQILGMRRPRFPSPAAALLGLALAACGDEGAGPPTDGGELPALLSELVGDGAGEQYYEPGWQLWTNGSVKRRTIELTEGGEIGTASRTSYDFPEGTRFLKTFSYLTQASPATPVPVETRVIRRRAGEWETGVYLWRADGSDAELGDGASEVQVPVVDKDGHSFSHRVPSRGQCQVCHGNNTTFIIGFTELQLNSMLAGETGTQLAKFYQNGTLGGALPSTPAEIAGPDAATVDILGYVQGNCVHCHNTRSSLDLSPATFLVKTVNQAGPFTGRRLIVPQKPDSSEIYLRFSSGQMPALGVQFGDSTARAMVRDWIMTHNFTN
jgi:mono/diheme cytochrome c family protein